MNSQELRAWLAEADLCDYVELLEGMSKKVRRWKRRAQKNGGVPFLLAQLDARVGARIRYLNRFSMFDEVAELPGDFTYAGTPRRSR